VDIKFLGRKYSMALYSCMCGIIMFLLAPVNDKMLMIVLVLCCKFFLYGLWAIIGITRMFKIQYNEYYLDCYTPESYPTTVRSTGNAAASCAARFAGLEFNSILF
jgi:hypothetical protein